MRTAATPLRPLVLISGDDEFAVKTRAKELYQQWCDELGGTDHEIIDATANNSDEAIKALNKLREALQTLPFFGTGKAIWLRDCNFLGDDRTASSKLVTADLADLAQVLKTFSWGNVRLLISAGKVDKRKTFYKTVEKNGSTEIHAGLSIEDKDWQRKADNLVRNALRELKKEIAPDALAELVLNVGPNSRLLNSEIEKLALYVGERNRINVDDVAAIVTRNKQSRAFALADALGDRNLPHVLKRLDEELWSMQFDKQKTVIGVLYGLVAKVRVMLLTKEMEREGWLKGEPDSNRIKGQLERIPPDRFPEDRRFNPLSMHPYMLGRAWQQSRNYSGTELVRAMELLLECNLKMISAKTDSSLILQQTLVQIAGGAPAKTARTNRT